MDSSPFFYRHRWWSTGEGRIETHHQWRARSDRLQTHARQDPYKICCMTIGSCGCFDPYNYSLRQQGIWKRCLIFFAKLFCLETVVSADALCFKVLMNDYGNDIERLVIRLILTKLRRVLTRLYLVDLSLSSVTIGWTFLRHPVNSHRTTNEIGISILSDELWDSIWSVFLRSHGCVLVVGLREIHKLFIQS